MYLKSFGICVLKHVGLTLLVFYSVPGLPQQVTLKKAKVKLKLLADIDMLLIVKKAL